MLRRLGRGRVLCTLISTSAAHSFSPLSAMQDHWHHHQLPLTHVPCCNSSDIGFAAFLLYEIELVPMPVFPAAPPAGLLPSSYALHDRVCLNVMGARGKAVRDARRVYMRAAHARGMVRRLPPVGGSGNAVEYIQLNCLRPFLLAYAPNDVVRECVLAYVFEALRARVAASRTAKRARDDTEDDVLCVSKCARHE